MESVHSLSYDYLRAVRLLETKINTPIDLVKFWSFSGPCLEDYPAIERINNKSDEWLAFDIDNALQLSSAPPTPPPPYV